MISSEKVRCHVAVEGPNRLNSRRWLIENYLNLDFTTTQQRESWIHLALTTGADDGYLFLDVDFSNLREVNTAYKDKNLNTSIGNKEKEVLQALLLQVLKSWGLKTSSLHYSDYKSYRVGMYVKNRSLQEITKLEHDLGLAFEATNQIFSNYLISNNLIPKEDLPSHWFRGGLGKTADQANYAARTARDFTGRNRLRKFDQPEIQEHLKVALKWSEIFRQELAEVFKGTGLFHRLDSGIELPTIETFELLRKLPDPEELKKALITKFGHQDAKVAELLQKKLTTVMVEKLQNYKILADTFSPSLMNADRKVASLENADYGGMVADFAGLGALNLHATAEALAKSTDIDSMLILVRQAEQTITKRFKELLSEFNAIIELYYNSTVSTGDDFAALLSGPLGLTAKKRLIRDLAEKTSQSRKRIAFIAAGVKKEDRNIIAFHGESLEKEFRLQIEGKLDPAKLAQLLVAVDMQGLSKGNGAVKMILGVPKNQSFSIAESGIINMAFSKSVSKFNQENQTAYQIIF